MGSECSSHQQAIKQSSNLSHPAFTSDPPCALSKWSLKCAHKQSRSLLKSQIYPLWIMKQKAKTNAHQWPINIFGWWFQPLWKILVSWDDYSQYMEEMFQTTNQIYIYIFRTFRLTPAAWNLCWSPLRPSATWALRPARLAAAACLL